VSNDRQAYSGWGVEDVHTQLNTRAKKWAAEVPLVLRSLWTMPNRSTKFTTFLWCTVQRSCCPPNYSMGPPRSRPTNLMRPSKHGKTSLTCLKNQGTSLSGWGVTDVHTWLSTIGRKWAAEVPSVLRSLRTTPNRSTNFTPFYGVRFRGRVALQTAVWVPQGPGLPT
jgi:hypothetical protein